MVIRTDVTDVQGVAIGVEPSARTAPTRRRAPIIAAILLAAVAAGGGIASAGPSAEQLEQAHWQAVVEHYRGLYQANAGADAAYWQQVVDHYEAQWIQR